MSSMLPQLAIEWLRVFPKSYSTRISLLVCLFLIYSSIGATQLIESDVASDPRNDGTVEGLGKLQSEHLERLTVSESDSVAFAAAWQMAYRDLFDYSSTDNVVPNIVHRCEKIMSRLTGFINGRLKCTPPSWWREQVEGIVPLSYLAIVKKLSTNEYSTNDLAFSVFPPVTYHESERRTVWCSDGVQLSDENGTISVGSSSYNLLKIPQLIETGRWRAISGVQTSEGRSVLAIHSQFSIDRVVIISLTADGDVAWEATVQIFKELGGASGTGVSHRLTLVSQSDQIVLFGADSDAFYFIAVDQTSGNVLSQFSTRLAAMD